MSATRPPAGAGATARDAVPLRTTRPARWQVWRSWPRDTRDTLFLLLVIGWTLLPHLSHLPTWCSALAALVLGWRASLALTQQPLPRRWKVLAVLAVAVGLTWWSEQGLLGREAGVMLLVVLMALKTLELRARRDAMVVFFLGFFLVLTHCLYSQSLLTALAMVLSTWGLLTALVLANMPVGQPTLRRAGALAARSALLGLPVMAALFLLFPRIGPLWGLPQDSVGRTGLSGSLRLGGVAGLANDDSIAFRVRFAPGADPPSQALYFRGPVLTHFDGVEWLPTLLALQRPPQPPADLTLQGQPLAYELLIEPIRLPLLPLLELTPRLPADPVLQARWQPWLGTDLLWHTEQLLTERVRLQAQAWPRFQQGGSQDMAELLPALQLPRGGNPRTLAWGQQMRRQLGPVDARTAAAAVLAHIGTAGYTYTLQPGLYAGDAIDGFWLDRREGFCEHFATAFVVVMRAMGVPARVVTGYQGADAADADGWRAVRQNHAHAWAEYWMAGVGWQRADPTGAVAPERVRDSRPLPAPPGLVGGALRSVSPALAEQLRRTWALLDGRWSQWVMGYSRQRQFDLLARLGVPHPDGSDLLRALVVLLSAGALAGAAWAAWDRRRQDPWQRQWRRLGRLLVHLGVAAPPHQPPRGLAAAVRQRHGSAGEALATLLDALDQHRYAPGGQRLPPRGWWRQVRRAAASLPRAAPPATG